MSLLVTAASFGGASVPAIQMQRTQDVAYNAAGGGAVQSAPFESNLIGIAVKGAVRIWAGVNPDAANPGTSSLLPGAGTWFVVVAPGWTLSAVSDDTNTGTVNITEAAMMG